MCKIYKIPQSPVKYIKKSHTQRLYNKLFPSFTPNVEYSQTNNNKIGLIIDQNGRRIEPLF